MHWLMLGIFRLKARGQWFLLYFSFGLVECVVVVLLVLDNQLPSHRARDNSSSAAHVSIPSTKPIRFGAPRIVAIILVAAHQQFGLSFGALDNHYTSLAYYIYK